MAGDIIQNKPRGERGLRRRRRIGVRVDMTPMISMALILLTFYLVVTAVFAKQVVMEISLRPYMAHLEIKPGLTIRIDADGRYWWNLDKVTHENLPKMIPALDLDSLRSFLVECNRPLDSLSTLLLIHREASFSSMVDILDEFELVEQIINRERADSLGVNEKRLPRSCRFLYRYAMGEWGKGDDRAIRDALELVQEGGNL